VNVTFVIPYFYPAWQYGGQPRSAYELARALAGRGHNVKVLTTDSAGLKRLAASDTGPGGRRSIEGVNVIYYRNISNSLAYQYRFFWPTGMFREMYREMRGCDLIHIHELRSTLSVRAYSAARRLGIPFVLSAHGGLKHLGRARLKTIYDTLWGRRMLRDARAVLAISPVEENDAAALHVERSRLRRLPNAIAVSDYSTLPQSGEFRRRMKVDGGKIILFLGRLHWIKGADLLVAAFSRLLKSHPDALLALAGPDDGQETELRNLTNRMNVGDRVLFAGYLDHKAKLEAYVDAAVVVVPSRSEVFAITAIEALMCGRPVLLSSACGLFPPPQPEHGVLTFRSEDVDDLAARLSAILSGPQFEQQAARGRAFAAREFGSERIAEQAEDIYSDVLQCSTKVSS
jgi:glycosyltransferase involved in cell wall biosynthesis